MFILKSLIVQCIKYYSSLTFYGRMKTMLVVESTDDSLQVQAIFPIFSVFFIVRNMTYFMEF